MKTLLALAVAVLVLISASGARADKEEASSLGVSSTRLGNGLTVLVQPDDVTPLVSLRIRYPLTGAAMPPTALKMLQDLMTSGTRHVGEGEYRRLLVEAGATGLIALVHDDAMELAVTVPSNQLALVLWLWSDQLGFFSEHLDQKRLDAERERIRPTLRTELADATRGAMRRVFEELFPVGSPYHPAPFTEADLDRLTVRDLVLLHERVVTPDHAILSIVGDVTTADTVLAVRRYFGPIPAAHAASTPPPALGALAHDVRLELAGNVRLPMVVLAWRTPALYAEGDADLDVAAWLLSGERIGWLRSKLVEKERLATFVEAHQYSRNEASFFLVRALVAEGHSPTEVLEAIEEGLDELTTREVSRLNIHDALFDGIGERLFQLQHKAERAHLLGGYVASGRPPNALLASVARYDAVTQRTMQAVTQRGLIDAGRVVAVLTPRSDATSTTLTSRTELPRRVK